MNVFVLTPGRAGSTTFTKACKHITNFTAAHESKVRNLGNERVNFAKNHIEVDNRLCWFLGRLDKNFGNDAFYVYLTRDKNKVAASYAKRWFKPISIMRAFQQDILFRRDYSLEIALDYANTIEENVVLFLKDKTNKMTINLENIKEDFPAFWEAINAEGNLENAILEFDKIYNPNNKITNKTLHDRFASIKEKSKYFLNGILHLIKYM